MAQSAHDGFVREHYAVSGFRKLFAEMKISRLCVLAGALLFLPLTAMAGRSLVVLSCYARQSNHADSGIKRIDKIVIDVPNMRVDLFSSAIGDEWTFVNRGYNKELDWFDEIAIGQFADGRILAGGVRAKATFGFDYSPKSGQLVYTFTDYGTPGYVIFDCTPL